MPTSAADLLAREGFGIDNLPYGACIGEDGRASLRVRLGDHALDLAVLARSCSGLDPAAVAAVDHDNLDILLAAGRPVWAEVRRWMQSVLRDPDASDRVLASAEPLDELIMVSPFTVGDYVDFYASEEHASNVGRIFRPVEAPLKPNWKHIPVSYHGRSGTIRVSGTEVIRPKGLRATEEGDIAFGPSRKLDIEAEIGFVCGGAAPRGEVALDAADQHLFGAVLLNDWSARDIQAFEYVPLGPHLGKSFASSISAWVIPWEALADARLAPPARTTALAAYLDDSDTVPSALDIELEVEIDGTIVSRPPFRRMYWTAPQMLAHMTVNNASLRPGDFFGSGTVSGPEPETRGSLLELTWDGRDPLPLSDGRSMTFLEDGQEVVLRASAHTRRGTRISFSECRASIASAT